MNHDLAVAVSSDINPPNTLAKPSYLIYMDSTNKKQAISFFLTVDKPEMTGNFVQVKGFFVQEELETIMSSFKDIISKKTKADVVELLIPIHSVKLIRNLVFKAK